MHFGFLKTVLGGLISNIYYFAVGDHMNKFGKSSVSSYEMRKKYKN